MNSNLNIKFYILYRPFLVLGVLVMFFLMGAASIQAQQSDISDNDEKGNFTDNLFTGGNFGFSFGQDVTFIEVAPIVGKKITDNIAIGIGPSYRYIYFNDVFYQYSLYDMKMNNYGFSIFGRYYLNSDMVEIFNNLFTHTEVEYNYMAYKLIPNDKAISQQTGGIDFTNIYVGGGYKQPIGDFSSFNLLILWNLNETPFSPYPNPLLRVGFTVGL